MYTGFQQVVCSLCNLTFIVLTFDFNRAIKLLEVGRAIVCPYQSQLNHDSLICPKSSLLFENSVRGRSYRGGLN